MYAFDMSFLHSNGSVVCSVLAEGVCFGHTPIGRVSAHNISSSLLHSRFVRACIKCVCVCAYVCVHTFVLLCVCVSDSQFPG